MAYNKKCCVGWANVLANRYVLSRIYQAINEIKGIW